jgi:UDP-4-amino-4,6-dideoxy-N-acetyl-beta-L-altrosamine transaminase
LFGMPIPYGRQSVDESDIAAVVDVLRSPFLTQGPAVTVFEDSFAQACDAPHAVAFSSGTAALHAAAFAGGVGPGDDLLTSAITFSASANCGAYVGATPRFADIDPVTWNVTPETVADAMTPATRAVIPVHFTGLPADVRGIRQVVGDDVLIIEDAAHALGSVSSGEPIGACRYADMAIFSTHPLKTITTGEGGVVTTADATLAERLRIFRNHGFGGDVKRMTAENGGWFREQQELGFNYRLSDIHSALGASQLRRLDRFVQRRNEIAERYREGLGDLAQVELPAEPMDGDIHAYHLFVLRHRDGSEARRQLYDALHAADILVQVHYIPVYWHPWYQRSYGYERGMCLAAERYYDGCLSLPCFPDLTESEQDRVVNVIRAAVAG